MTASSSEALGGRFTLQSKRISFPCGDVWEASGDGGERMLALVFTQPQDDATARAAAALQASQAVDSPHVVPWTDAGATSDGCVWVVAPLVGEQTFSEWVKSEGGLNPSDAAPVVHQLSRALAAGEGAGHVHHMVCGEFVRLEALPGGGHAARLYGYGLTEVMGPYQPLKRKDPFLGAPNYMAPELCGGKPADHIADVYAVGIFMYEAIRGRAPFASISASATPTTTMKRQVFEKPLALHLRYGSLDHIRAYEAITLTALQKKADQRQATAGTLTDALASLCVDEMNVALVDDGNLSAP